MGEDPGTLGHGASSSQMNFGQVLTLIQNMQNDAKEEIRIVREEVRKLEDRNKEDIKAIRDDLQSQEDRGRGRARELHDKVDEQGKLIFSKFENLIKDIDVKHDSISESITGLESDKESFVTQIKDLKKRVDKIEKSGDINKRLGDLEEAKNINKRLDDLEESKKLSGDVNRRLTNLEEAVKEKDQFADLPFYFKPAWVKAFGLAIAAVIVALFSAFLLLRAESKDDKKDNKEKSSKTSIENPEKGRDPGDEILAETPE